MFRKKYVFINFVKFTRKHLWQTLFVLKLNFTKFLRTLLLKEHLRWLLLITALQKHFQNSNIWPEVFRKKDVFINFVKFTRKHLWQTLFVLKLNFTKFLRTLLLKEHLRWLLLITALQKYIVKEITQDTIRLLFYK